MQAEIFVKANCLYCVKAKDLLIKHKIEYDVISIEENRDVLFARVRAATGDDPKTAPQIFIDGGQYIGGYDQLVIWVAANITNNKGM